MVMTVETIKESIGVLTKKRDLDQYRSFVREVRSDVFDRGVSRPPLYPAGQRLLRG